MKALSPWNCTPQEKLAFLESNPFPQNVRNQNRLNELDEVIKYYGTALPIIRMLDEIQEVVREYNEERDGNLCPQFRDDVRFTLRSLMQMFINIEEIDQTHPDTK
jgi:hypothetical protein